MAEGLAKGITGKDLHYNRKDPAWEKLMITYHACHERETGECSTTVSYTHLSPDRKQQNIKSIFRRLVQNPVQIRKIPLIRRQKIVVEERFFSCGISHLDIPLRILSLIHIFHAAHKRRPPGRHSGWLRQLCVPRSVCRYAAGYGIYNRIFGTYRNGSRLRTRCV